MNVRCVLFCLCDGFLGNVKVLCVCVMLVDIVVEGLLLVVFVVLSGLLVLICFR